MSFPNTLITEKNGRAYGRMIHPWLRKKQDIMSDSPSRRDGMTYEEELSKRQQGGVFIFDVVQQLTHLKGEHGLSGVAATLFNRFFNIHSFKKCDFRDVAAACIFLAGKNEDSPKKLKYVVNQLWHFKFPHNKQFPSEQHFIDQCNVVTFLEEVLLKTISFDINVDLPHQYVLKLMREVERGRNVYKEMVKTAYYMASDVLIVTDWSVRYSCAAIATACINIASFFHNIRMDDIVPLDLSEKWYKHQDNTMTREEIDAMTKEFLEIYSRNPHCHIGSLKKIDPHGKIPIVGRSTSQVSSSLTASSSSTNLKVIDLESYKGRQKPATGTPSSESARPSFLPDVKDQKVVEQSMMEQRIKEESHRNHHHRQHHHRHSSTSSTSSGPQQPPIPSSTSMSQPRNPHDESRPFKRSMGPEEINGVKKSRMDYQMNFVAASSSTTVKSNGYYEETHQETISTYAMEVSRLNKNGPQPLMQNLIQPMGQPSAYQQMCMDYKNKRNPSFSDPRHTMSSTQQISPPDESSPPVSSTILLPPPPPPPLIPPRFVDEMEEGELL